MGKSQLTAWCDSKTGLVSHEQQLIGLLNQENEESDPVLQFQISWNGLISVLPSLTTGDNCIKNLMPRHRSK